MKKVIYSISLIILLTVSFGLGFFIGRANQPSILEVDDLCNKTLGQPEKVDFSLFWDAWRIIEKKYVDRKNLNYQEMVYGAISGLLGSLKDPYSVFLPPQESKKFLDDMGGSFEGIGAEIGIRKGILTVIAPLEGSPAKRAGLEAGDKILKVDDTPTADLTLDEAVNLIRGPRGTEVRLLIMRDSWERPKEIKIIRDKIKIPVLKWEMKEDKIAYVQLYHFTESAVYEFNKAVREIQKAGAQKMILDLRNNPGGYLEVAVEIAGWFLPKGKLVAVEDFGNGQKIEYRSRGNGELKSIPLVILVNQGSASASEILAGALRDHLGIKLIGQKTYGKGSVQELEKLKGGGSIKITVAQWLTPSGQSIRQQGLEPDISVEEPEGETEEDLTLKKALEVIKKL